MNRIYLYLVLSTINCTMSCELPESNVELAALILARGGSKGIPLKNIAKIHGVSLLGRSLTSIHESGVFNEIWVSTDHKLIAEEAEKFNASVHWRPQSVSGDKTSSIESVTEFLKHHPNIKRLALIQCTSVFLKPKYLKEAAQKMLNHNVDCIFSVNVSHKLRWRRQNERVTPINFDPKNRPRRQDWNGELVENGMFYFAKTNLLCRGVFQNNRCNVVKIDQEDSLEIDTPADLKLARLLLL